MPPANAIGRDKVASMRDIYFGPALLVVDSFVAAGQTALVAACDIGMASGRLPNMPVSAMALPPESQLLSNMTHRAGYSCGEVTVIEATLVLVFDVSLLFDDPSKRSKWVV